MTQPLRWRGRRAAEGDGFPAPIPLDDAWIDTLRAEEGVDDELSGPMPSIADALADQRELIAELAAKVAALEAAVRQHGAAPSTPRRSVPPVAVTARGAAGALRGLIVRSLVAAGLLRFPKP